MENIRQAKKALRSRIRAAREQIPREEIERKSRAAAKHVIGSPEFENADVIALYRACFGEVDTDGIFEAARSRGKTVIYPKTDVKNRKLHFGEVDRLDKMTPGQWNIPEPPPDARRVSLEEAALVVTPGVAFDAHGGRLGMGGGFYDAMLTNIDSNTVKMGLAYDFQVVDSVPMDENDQRMDCLVTESGVMRFPERG